MTQNWVVTITLDLDPDMAEMDAWEQQLADIDAVVGRVPRRGVEVTLYAADLGIDGALRFARERVAAVVTSDPIGIEVITEDEHLRRADSPTVPELMSAAEIADELGVSRQRVHQLRAAAAFPSPLADLRGGAVWDARAIRKFASEWERKPGRPAANPGLIPAVSQ